MGPPQFGKRVPGQVYHDRPGDYGIAGTAQEAVLVIVAGGHVGFPGGGLEPDEAPTDGLVREFREETGYRVSNLRFVGSAGQFRYAKREWTYFNKLCRFYRVDLIGEPLPALDDDHQMRWMHYDDALASLSEEAHRWALHRAF